MADECWPCGDARGLSMDRVAVSVVQERMTNECIKTIHKDNAQAAEDSISVREEHDENVKVEELRLLMETHEDTDEERSNNSIQSYETAKPDYHGSSDTLTADEEIFTDEDRSEDLAQKASIEASKKRQQGDSGEYLPSSSDEALASCDEETSDEEFIKKPFQNIIKPVIWCVDCEAVAKMLCSIQQHKKNYCCAVCVSGNSVENLSLKDFPVHFSDIRSFDRHAMAKHCGTENLYEPEICRDCNRTFRVEKDSNKKGHMCEYKIKPFSCSMCHKHFFTEIGQKVHYRRLHGHYQHACKYCMIVFNTKQSKLEHEQSHKDDTLPYICPDCPEKFKDFVTRSEHLKTHRGKKKYICSTCNRKFTALHRYERHLRIHSGEKPYKCEVCDRSFNQDGHLKSHMRLHTGEKPFLCEHCGESFNHNISLKNHRQRQHGIDPSCMPADDNKQIGRPIRSEDHPRRQRKMHSTADTEICEYEKQQKRGQKRKSRRKNTRKKIIKQTVDLKLSSV